VVVCWLCTWRLAAKRWRTLGLLVLTSLLVFAPEGIYFLRHPQEFLLRTQGVSAGSRGISTLVKTCLDTLGMFFVRGDANPTWSLIGQPVFAPWMGGLFVFGIGVALWKSRTAPPARWTLCCFAVMLLPALLSIDAPDSQRALAAAPATFLFPALAVEVIGQWLHRIRLGYSVLGLAVGAAVAAGGFNAYFNTWAHDPDTYGATAVSRVNMADLVAGFPAARRYFADSDITGHVVRMLVPTTDQDGWIPESSAAIPLPSRPEGDTLYVSTTSAAMKDLVPAWLPGVKALPHPDNPLGKPDFFAFTWSRQSAQAFLGQLQPAGQRLGTDYTVVSYGLAQGSAGLVVNVVWQPIQPAGPYDMYVHLLDAGGKVVGQSDRLVWPVRDFSQAREGLGPIARGYFDEGRETDDWLLTQHAISAPAGAYTVEIGLAHRDPANPDAVSAGIGSFSVPATIS
jgi:hypothetical protein